MFIEIQGEFVPYQTGPLPNGIIPPGNIAVRPSDEKLELGIYTDDMIAPAAAVPNGQISTGLSVKRIGGVVRYVHTLVPAPVVPLADRKAALKEQIKLQGLAVRRQGFHWNFGTADAPNIQILQLREPTPQLDDEKNWLVSLTGYTAMVMIGQGALPNAKFRTESNETFTLTYQGGMTVLLSLQGWASGLFNISWAKQEQVDAAADHAALDLLEADILNGWGG